MKKLKEMTRKELVEAAQEAAKEMVVASLTQELWANQTTALRGCFLVEKTTNLSRALEFLWTDAQGTLVSKALKRVQDVVTELSERDLAAEEKE